MNTFTQSLKEFITRHQLTEAQAAGLLGVPVHTYKKWANGTRTPGAATARLLEVFCTLEILAPDVLATLIPEVVHVRELRIDPEVAHVEKLQKGK